MRTIWKLSNLTLLLALMSIMFCNSAIAQQQAQMNDESFLSFRENKGQVIDQFGAQRTDILFSGKSGSLSFHLSETGIHYQIHNFVKKIDLNSKISKTNHLKESSRFDFEHQIYRVDLKWVGMSENCQIKKGTPVNGVENFLNTSGELLYNVLSYNEITYENLYPGIDLRWYQGKNGMLEYDLLIEPGADYRQVQLDIAGAEIKVSESGQLILVTPFGEITEGALKVYQGDQLIKANWNLKGNIASFNIPQYDPNHSIRIDPPVALRQWGTYYGGTSWDVINNSVFDNSGDIISTGYTLSSNNIATSGAYQTSFSGGRDAILLKFNTAGARIWATYVGGFGQDDAYECSVDGSGNIYIAGTTSSANGISTAGAYQVSYSGSAYDAFVMKFTNNGMRTWGTYLGGNGSENVYGCSADNNSVVVCGFTDSNNGISTAGAYQVNFAGTSDAFVAKFDNSGGMLWSTYYGGPVEDYGSRCRLDASGNVFLVGSTSTVFGMTTSGAFQENYAGGDTDGFLVRFNSDGTLGWATYIGGFDYDDVLGCDVDGNGNVAIVGWTLSPAGYATTGVYQETYYDYGDAYILKFDNSGNRIWGTYYGGEGNDILYYCAFDAAGNIYVSGVSESLTSIATQSAHQSVMAGSFDGCYAKFDLNGQILYGSYYGGTEFEGANSIDANNSGGVIISGSTDSNNGISSAGSYQPNFGGGTEDGWMAYFLECNAADVSLVNTDTPNDACPGYTITLSVTGNLNDNNDWEWYENSCGGVSVGTGTSITVNPTTTTSFFVRGEGGTCADGPCESVNADIVYAPIQEICLVTSDSATGNFNQIVWEKPLDLAIIDSFYIYREITTNVYGKIGAKHKDSLSIFDDLTANPNSTSYRYKLSVLDTCGTEVEMGYFHKSIHLQYSGLGNFQWTVYDIESTSNQVASYNFYRDDNSTGNFTLLSVVPGGNNTFTDVNYLSFPNARYRVDLNWISGGNCAPTRVGVNTSRSNIKSANAINGQDELLDENSFQVYPNPATSLIQIQSRSNYPMENIRILDASGRLIRNQVVNSSSCDVNIETLESGIYFLEIKSSAGNIIRKFTKQ